MILGTHGGLDVRFEMASQLLKGPLRFEATVYFLRILTFHRKMDVSVFHESR